MNDGGTSGDGEAPAHGSRAGAWVAVGSIALLLAVTMFLVVRYTGIVEYAQRNEAELNPFSKAAQARRDAGPYLRRGLAKKRAGDLDGAIEEYTNAIEIDPDNSFAHLDRGYAWELKGNAEKAIADYDEAIKLKPEDPQAYFYRGLVKKQKWDLEGAIADFDTELKLEPGNYYGHLDRGMARAGMGNMSGAMEDFNRAVEINPGKPDAYTSRGDWKRTQGDFDGAMRDCEKLIVLRPRDAEGYIARGNLRMLRQEMDGAIADFNKAVELDPARATTYLERARCKTVQGDADGAIADCDKAIAMQPRYSRAYSHRGYSKMLKQDFTGALEDVTKSIALFPSNFEAYETRAGIKYATGDSDGALADMNQAIEASKGRSGTAFHERGCIHYDRREFPAALSDFNKAAGLHNVSIEDVDYTYFRIYLTRSLMNEHAREDLAAYLSKRKALAIGDDWPLKIGRFLTGRMPEGDLIAAAQDSDAYRGRGKLCEAWFYVGSQHLIDGDKAIAQEDFKKSMATNRADFVEYESAAANLKFLEAGQ